MLDHDDRSKLCCTSGLDSPELPARPRVNALDGATDTRYHLASILAAAVLPDGHPHALVLRIKKAECDESIIRSPGIVDKMKMQFRGRSTGLLRSKSAGVLSRADSYDDDAQSVNSADVERRAGLLRTEGVRVGTLPFEIREANEEDRNKDWLVSARYERYAIPLNLDQGCADLGASHSPSLTATGRLAATIQALTISPPRTVRTLPETVMSFPNLITCPPPVPSVTRRAQSVLGLPQSLHTTETRTTSGSEQTVLHARSPTDECDVNDGEDHHACHLGKRVAPRPDTAVDNETELGSGSQQRAEVHLHTMDISEQLRPMSQMSDPTEPDLDSLFAPTQTWNFQLPEHQSIEQGAAVLTAVRVKSPAQASSVYSRPSSPNIDKSLQIGGMPAQWPLLDFADTGEAGNTKHETVDKLKVEPPGIAMPRSDQLSNFGSVKWLCPSTRALSTSEKSGNSQQSKQSRFVEWLSPPKKLVRKRRSIFKFLHPSGHKQQIRSISSPMLILQPGEFDGPSDDPALLTVSYELTEPPVQSKTARSTSMVSLRVPMRAENAVTVPRPETLHMTLDERRPSMVEYERSLSIAGDDRRRSSAGVDQRKQYEIEDDGRRASTLFARTLSRAKPLGDTPGQLMAQALAKHQDEKAMFRSASKHKESLAHEEPFDVCFDHGGPSYSAADVPLAEISPVRPTVSMGAFSFSGRVRPRSGTQKVPRMGTSLASWSRFPSHSRPERSASASKADDMIVRDFAVDSKLQAAQNQSTSPESKRSGQMAKGRSKGGLTKSRSSTFSGFVRYYANIFSTGANQNRRTSVATGGWLEHPDLEMLPTVPFGEGHHSHHHTFRQHLHELEEAMREEVEALEAETDKLVHPSHTHHRDADTSGARGAPAVEVAGRKSPFRPESPFQESYFALPIKRPTMACGPDDEGLEEEDPIPFKLAPQAEEGRIARPPASLVPGPLHLDGTTEENAPGPISKATAWADVYGDCVVRTTCAETKAEFDRKAMPPPILRPTKPRSPQQLKPISKTAVIRRFPSVTVIDDCKGHSRSVSLISVVEGCGIMRSSTIDLIDLIEKREREEREKLLNNAWKV